MIEYPHSAEKSAALIEFFIRSIEGSIMKSRSIGSDEPRVGEILELKKTLYGGNDIYTGLKVHEYEGAKVEVVRVWTEIQRDDRTLEVTFDHRMVQFKVVGHRDRWIRVRKNPPIQTTKMGSLRHALGHFEDQEHSNILDTLDTLAHNRAEDERQRESTDSRIAKQLATMKTRMQAEEVAKRALLESGEWFPLEKCLLSNGTVLPLPADAVVRTTKKVGKYWRMECQDHSAVYIVEGAAILDAMSTDALTATVA